MYFFLSVFSCHPWTGHCDCLPGWTGDYCSRPCPPLTFGKDCQKTCNCMNGALCDPVTGDCICENGYIGEQ